MILSPHRDLERTFRGAHVLDLGQQGHADRAFEVGRRRAGQITRLGVDVQPVRPTQQLETQRVHLMTDQAFSQTQHPASRAVADRRLEAVRSLAMTKETKLGLLIGGAFIFCFALILILFQLYVDHIFQCYRSWLN